MPDLTPVLASIAAATGATLGSGTAGATIAQGDVLYADGTDGGDLKLADDGALASSAVVGIALNAASDGQPIDYIKSGTLTFGAATTSAGAPYFLSTTAGNLMNTIPASGNFSSFLAVGLSTSTMKVGINNAGVAVP